MQIIWTCLIFSVLLQVELLFAKDEACFRFFGNGFLRFNLPIGIKSTSSHYSMKFSTSQLHGILFHTEGIHGDSETLFLRNGKLFYRQHHSYAGDFMMFEGVEHVNTGKNITVHIYREFPVSDKHKMSSLVHTGGTREYTILLEDKIVYPLILSTEVYIGGFHKSLKNTPGNFSGQIWDFRDEKHDANIRRFNLNPGDRVSTFCRA